MTGIFRVAATGVLIVGLALPARADEVEDALETALDAYRAGDIAAAKEEIDFAAQLLAQQRAAGLGDFLPEALPGWTRLEEQNRGQSGAAFGGGMAASANYRRGTDHIEVELMADNQIVTAMAAMFGNVAMMGAMGQVKRIGRQKVVVTPEGEVQALVDNRILVKVSGNAPIEDKEAYFKAIDIRGLKDF